MIQIDDFAKMLQGEADILYTQTADLSQSDSLLQPKPSGNCLNWVLGHLARNLAEILDVIDGERPEDLIDLKRYKINSEPIRGEEEGVQPIDLLVKSYQQLTEIIVNRLGQMSEADFDEEIEFWQGKKSRGYVAFFYFFNNTYHIGQLEQLRNLAGKTEKVI